MIRQAKCKVLLRHEMVQNLGAFKDILKGGS